MTPVLQADVLDQRRRPGNTRVVDQNVETTQALKRHLKQAGHLGFVTDVANHTRQQRLLLERAGQLFGIDITNEDFGTSGQKALRRGQANAAGRRRDEHALVGVGQGKRGRRGRRGARCGGVGGGRHGLFLNFDADRLGGQIGRQTFLAFFAAIA